jgi:hypothetical protein
MNVHSSHKVRTNPGGTTYTVICEQCAATDRPGEVALQETCKNVRNAFVANVPLTSVTRDGEL